MFYEDIINQPTQWQRCLDYSLDEGSTALLRATNKIKQANRVVLVGIGASYCAGLALQYLLEPYCLVQLFDASELQYRPHFKSGDLVLFLTRSGKSVELVKLAEICKHTNVESISICNDAESPVALLCNTNLHMNVDFDYTISVATYSAIIVIGLFLRDMIVNDSIDVDAYKIEFEKIKQSEKSVGLSNDFFAAIDFYFLGRGIDLATAKYASLLWHEACKTPAVYMSTGSFRHGPQEVVDGDKCFIIFTSDCEVYQDHDVMLKNDLQKNESQVMLHKSNYKKNNNFIEVLYNQYMVQLMAYEFAKINGVNPNEFKHCTFVIDKEGGL